MAIGTKDGYVITTEEDPEVLESGKSIARKC